MSQGLGPYRHQRSWLAWPARAGLAGLGPLSPLGWLGSLGCMGLLHGLGGLTGLALAAPLPAATEAVASPALRAALLQEAQAWSDKRRTDIARQKIAKLLAVEPGSPEGLAFLGDMALRENKLDEARKTLSTMQALQPQHPATRELEMLLQVYSQQHEKLSRMRLAARAGRSAEAAALARELFPNGPPRYGALGREIAQITGQAGGAVPAAVPTTKPVPALTALAAAGQRKPSATSLASKGSAQAGNPKPAPSAGVAQAAANQPTPTTTPAPASAPTPLASAALPEAPQRSGDRQAQANPATAATEAPRPAWMEIGQQNLEKNSTEGLSSLRGWERPVVAWLPRGDGGRLFAHVDPVQLDAGRYAGGDAFAQPGSEAITSGLPQRASGVNVGVGYQGDAVRWDLGETGVGFVLPNWVGGLRYAGELGSADYSLELSRRPLTGTLLSYAGMVDPQTGSSWGGVVATGLGGRLAQDFGPYSTSLSVSLASLTGHNVADNTRLRWRMAADRDVYRSPSQVVNLGLSLSGQQHDKDLSGFTWGHGGYYSPMHNLSLSVPLEWSGRQDRWTWLLRGSVSVSSSTSSATDYYPTNAAMQQQSGQVYAASSSTGSGWAVSGVAEYQVTPQLALGGRLEREVSDYYTPLNLLFYARYSFAPQREALAARPRPVQAYSQF